MKLLIMIILSAESDSLGIWLIIVVVLLIWSVLSNYRLNEKLSKQEADIFSERKLKEAESKRLLSEIELKLKNQLNEQKLIVVDKQNEFRLAEQRMNLEFDARLKALTQKHQTELQNRSANYDLRESELKALLNKKYQEWANVELAKFKKYELEKSAKQLLEEWKRQYEKAFRDDAIKRSTAVNLGKVTEHFIPFMSGFPYNPKDVRFLGSPIDLIIFDGHSDKKDEITIYMCEVKTGGSKLSYAQQRIREAVLAQRVKWIELNGEFAGKPKSEVEPELPFNEAVEESKVNKQPYEFYKDQFGK